ncbi:MAG: hypothetical protein HKO66_06780, partial [Saprospiraceae bacterium]|nr:hypothetical protein [Saprospiraceae bacterium]
NDQKRLTEAIQKNNIDNLIFVTGDTHTAWAFEATSDPFETYNPKTSEGAIGVEFGVTSITSGNSNERHPTDVVKKHEMKIANSDVNPHLKYVNMRDHGYLILTLDSDKVEADFKIVTTLKERDTSVKSDKKFVVKKGSTKLIGKL